MKQIRLLTLLVLLMTAATGATAQTEELLTTITLGGEPWSRQPVYTESGRATLETSGTVEEGMVVPEVFGWNNSSPLEIGSVTITAAEGYEITKVVFWDYDFMEGYGNALTDNASPFTCYLKSSQRSLNENMSSPNGYAIAKIEVYGYASTVAVTGVTLSPTTSSLTAGGAALELTPTVAPAGATDKTVKWSVTQEGSIVALYTDEACTQAVGTNAIAAAKVYVKPLAAGQATVTVTTNDGAKTATCTVTVAEPTYAVTFAEGTDPNEWNATPNTGLKQGDNVTVTYSGTKKVLGVKAEKKAAAPAGPVTYTELKGGEVLHVGDKIQVPETDKYWYAGGNALDYRYTYEVVRVNISGSIYETTATESETGAYYALHKVGSDSYLFATGTFDDSSRLPATATSDGIAVADNGFTNGYHKYIFSVHEP